MASYTLISSQTLSTLHCSECQVLFALDDNFIAQRRKDRKTWYCPNGHSQWYPGRTAEQERDEARAQLEAARRTTALVRRNLEAERRSKAAYKGALTKARKRVGKGTCPECRRHFPALREHMSDKHPELATKEEA